MVVGTHVEIRMGIAFVPDDALFVVSDTLHGLVVLLFAHDRAEYPTAGGYGMCLEQLHMGGSRHLRGDNGGEVVFYADEVDGREVLVVNGQTGDGSVLYDNLQVALKHLLLFAFPMEAHADNDIVEREAAIGIGGIVGEKEFGIQLALEANMS